MGCQPFLCIRLYDYCRKHTHTFPTVLILRRPLVIVRLVYVAELLGREGAKIIVGQTDVANGYAQNVEDA